MPWQGVLNFGETTMTEKKTTTLDLLESYVELNGDTQRAIFEIIGNQNLAISRLAELLAAVPDIDKEKLSKTVSDFESFLPSGIDPD